VLFYHNTNIKKQKNMMSKKNLIYLITGVVVIVFLVTFSAKWLSQKNPTEKTSKVPTGFKEVKKEATSDKIAEETKEAPIDPKQITVSAMQGTGLVEAISKESITIKSTEKETTYNLSQEKLSILKKTGEKVTNITMEDIKIGDMVKLSSDKMNGEVNTITVLVK